MAINKKIETINFKIQDCEREKTKEQKNVHPIYNEESMMARGIKELEKRLHTTSLARAEEAIIIKEIKQVKESGPSFKKIDAIKDRINELKKERTEVQADLP